MRLLFNIVWGCCLAGFTLPLSGQVISGSVTDKEKKGIAFASIVHWLADGSQMLNYTTTDQTGRYELELKEPEGMLIVSSLGYKPDTLLLSGPQKDQNPVLDFQLETTAFDLQSVEVSDSRIPYKTEGDTVTYQSDFFTDGTEQVVEDLVRKLPGASVGEDGTIFYKGKQVDKVLLEGDEMFGRKYTIGTRSLRSDVVDEIQFINHYVENALLKEVQQSDQLAMNISIKEDRKKLLFGDAELGGGIPGRYEGDVNLFSLYKKNKGVLVGNAENTAGSPLNISSLFQDGFSLDAPYEYQRSARDIVRISNNMPFDLKKAEIKNGNVHQGAANLVFNPGDQLKIRSFGLGYRDRWALDKGSLLRDLNLGTQYEYEDQSFYDENNRGLEWNAEALWQLSRNSNLKYTFNTSNNRIAEQAGVLIVTPGQDTVAQHLTSRTNGNIHRFNWVGKLKNKRVLVLDAAYVRQRNQQDFHFEQSNEQRDYIDQTNEHIVKDADLLASLLGKSGSLKYALNLKYRLQTDKLEVKPSTSDLLSQELDFREYFQNDYRQQFLAMIGSFSMPMGKSELFSKLELGYRHARWRLLNEQSKDQSDFYPNLKSGIKVRISKKSTFMLSGAVKTETPEIDHLISGPVWTSFRSVLLGTDQIDPYLNYSGIAAFAHSNNARLLELSANLMYSNNSRAFMDRYFYYGIFGVRNRQALNGGHHWSINGDLDKYLPGLSANVGLNMYSSVNRSLVLALADVPNEVQLWTRAIELSYTTVFDGPLNLGVNGQLNWNDYRQLQADSPVSSRSKRAEVDYLLIFKPHTNWFVKLTTRQIFTDNQQQKNKTLYFGTLRSEYQLGNGFRVGFNVYNLWNTRQYNLENLSGESYTLQSWVLNPRMMLINFGFRF